MKTTPRPFPLIVAALFAGWAHLGCGGQAESDDGATIGDALSAATIIEGPAKSLAGTVSGYNGTSFITPNLDIDDQGLGDVLDELGPGILRFPGGTLANYWDWRTGWFKNDKYTPSKYAAMSPKTIRAEEVQRMLGGRAIKVIWNLNVLTSKLEEQMAFLAHVHNDLHMPIEYVELGNELYWGGDPKNDMTYPHVEIFPTGSDYATTANAFITAIKAKYPAAKIAICLSPGVYMGNGRLPDWNGEVLSHVVGADAATFHPYLPSGQGNLIDKTVLAQPSTVRAILRQPDAWAQTELKAVIGALPTGMEAWATEFNLWQSEQIAMYGTWMHALFFVEMQLEFEAMPGVQVLTPHTLAENAQFGMVFTSKDGYGIAEEPDDPTRPATTHLGISTLGTAMEHIHRLTSATGTVRSLTFDASLGDMLRGYVFRDGTGPVWVVINRASQEVALNGGFSFSKPYQLRAMSAGALDRVGVGSTISPTTTALASGDPVTLAPLSISIIEPAP
jgi:hypothetical protein